MPPRESSLASSFPAVADAGGVLNEVICPLKNQDGTNCRKRCHGEKRYRSMQEHIRRAHPDYYIPKLPATEESFKRMVLTTPGGDRARLGPPFNVSGPQSTSSPTSIALPPTSTPQQYSRHIHPFSDVLKSSPETPAQQVHRPLSELPSYNGSHPYLSPHNGSHHHLHNASSAAAALTQLHNYRGESGFKQDYYSSLNQSYSAQANHTRYPTSAEHSPSRSTTLPPISTLPFRPLKPTSKSLRQSPPEFNVLGPRHERRQSKDHSKRLSHDRKAQSVDPENGKYGKRWEDLIDAAANATQQVVKQQQQQHYPPIESLPPRLAQSYAPPMSYSTHISPSNHLHTDRDRDRHSLPPSLASTFRFPPVHTASPLARQVDPARSSELPPFSSIGNYGDRSTVQFPTVPSERSLDDSAQKSLLFPRLSAGRPRSATAQGNLQRGMFMSSIPEKNSDENISRNGDVARSSSTKTFPFNRPAASSYHSPVMNSRVLSPGRSPAQIYGTPPHNYHAVPRVLPGAPSSPFSLGNGNIHLSAVSKPMDNRPLTLPPPQLPQSPRAVEMCCTLCHQFSPVLSGYVCNECINGFCVSCAETLATERKSKEKVKSPCCGSLESQFKHISLDLR